MGAACFLDADIQNLWMAHTLRCLRPIRLIAHLVQTVLQQHITDLLTEASDRFDPPGLGDRGADR